ncbi:hypothetical protein [Caldimonas brevitalea]|nr:hypothetical protein [Caldimonas brevitalea]
MKTTACDSEVGCRLSTAGGGSMAVADTGKAAGAQQKAQTLHFDAVA